ncbi:MAG TPA: GNAT family N-acetyltransferase [Polyangiaceae bacterium]|nr:GNAT family N-acetyltransferase [Polyangiaceae bacterium]
MLQPDTGEGSTATRVVLRLARAVDLAAVHTLIEELGYDHLEKDAFALGYHAVLADAAQQVWVAELEGVVVGLMSLSARPQMRLAGPILSVDELVVSEGARGAGVGRKLIDRAKSEAVRLGARRLELETARGRPSYARRFYPKNGFDEVDSAVMRWPVPTSAGG